jgi:hypothetical protein
MALFCSLTAVPMLRVISLPGLSVDVGRMYVVKSKSQPYADNAALPAGWSLDGASQGCSWVAPAPERATLS